MVSRIWFGLTTAAYRNCGKSRGDRLTTLRIKNLKTKDKSQTQQARARTQAIKREGREKSEPVANQELRINKFKFLCPCQAFPLGERRICPYESGIVNHGVKHVLA